MMSPVPRVLFQKPCMGASARYPAAYYGCGRLPEGFGQVELAGTVAALRRHAQIISEAIIIYLFCQCKKSLDQNKNKKCVFFF